MKLQHNTQIVLSSLRAGAGLTVLALSVGPGCTGYDPTVVDEAKQRLAKGEALPMIDRGDPDYNEDEKDQNYFPTHPWDNFGKMDGRYERVEKHKKEDPPTYQWKELPLDKGEIKGRNTWLMWSAGNQEFWNYLSQHGNGIVDFLKVLDNHHVPRDQRFATSGLINEPGFRVPDPDNDKDRELIAKMYGLHLDVADDRYMDDEYITNNGYGGVGIAQAEWWETKKQELTEPPYSKPWVPDPEVYGYSSGVIGLRLFPNPEWDERARGDWDIDAFFEKDREGNYTDRAIAYSKDPKRIRPFRVGMSCAACHVSFNPHNPPEDPANPEWENLASNIGNQYYRFGQLFGFDLRTDNLLYYLVNAPRPGTLDTSLLATDGNNNPNTMNSVFQVLPRLLITFKNDNVLTEEITSGDTREMPVLEPITISPPLTLDDGTTLDMVDVGAGLDTCYDRRTPHVLAVGEDSIGARGALCRVWVNIGEFSEEWRQDVKLMVGLSKQRPFSIAKAKRDSIYFNTSLRRSQNLARFFLTATSPMRLEDIPGAAGKLVRIEPDLQLQKGKEVFARNCFVCHSSTQPDRFWDDPTNWRRWIRDTEYLAWASEAVARPNFRDLNYFSTDQQYKITDIATNMGRALGDNATAGRVWESFSSETYKQLSQGSNRVTDPIILQHPYTGEQYEWRIPYDAWEPPAEYGEYGRYGPARYRPHTLVGIWATAPFLHNNSVGDYPYPQDPRRGQAADVSVEGRLLVFKDSMEKLLGLKPREGFASIYRTAEVTHLKVPKVILPDLIQMQLGLSRSGLVVLVVLVIAGLIGFFTWGWKLAKRKRSRFLRNISVVALTLVIIGTIWGAVWLHTPGFLSIGTFPKGTPVNLLLNLNEPIDLKSRGPETWKTLKEVFWDLKKVSKRRLPSLDHPDVPDLVPNLLKLNKSPDFVLDHGHEFGIVDPVTGEEISREDRLALIEYLKTL